MRISDWSSDVCSSDLYVTHDQAEALTLADRIVVMKDGVIQQIGTPDEIYERPGNMFVASFLGNPPINYLEGRLERERDVLHFRRGAVSLPLPASLAARLQGASPDGGVVLGIRPEDVNDRAAPAAERKSGTASGRERGGRD